MKRLSSEDSEAEDVSNAPILRFQKELEGVWLSSEDSGIRDVCNALDTWFLED